MDDTHQTHDTDDLPQGDIPGFTKQQAFALRALISKAVRDANRHDRRVTQLERCVYGNGREGIRAAYIGLAKDVGILVWWYRVIAGAVVGSWVSIILTIVLK